MKPDGQLDEADLPPVSLPLFDLWAALHGWGRGLLAQPAPAAVLAFPALSRAFAGLAWRQYQLAQSFALYLNARYGAHQVEGDRAVQAVAEVTQHARGLVERADELTPGWRPDSLDFALLERRAENHAHAFRYDSLVLDAIDVMQWGRSWAVLQSLFFILLRFSEEAQALADDMAAAIR
ncbi:hypothetical protein [Falsiroseomonas sp. CW058]|uniref:hypothetical protein n=1 Tax=Falsiroseomonas sp. CW058 TaxID=3388664 RepID=UPI003D31CF0B